MKNKYEMTEKEIHEIMFNLDLNKLHELIVNLPFGNQIYILTDGSLQILELPAQYETDDHVLHCKMTYEPDVAPYLNSWTKESFFDSDFVITNDNRIISTQKAIAEAIQNGDWTEWEINIKNNILRNWRIDIIKKRMENYLTKRSIKK